MLRDGSLNLTNLRLLIPALTPENHVAVFDSVRGKSKDQVLAIVAALRPKPDAPTVIRRLPDPGRSQVDLPHREADGESCLFTVPAAQQDTALPSHPRPLVSPPPRPITPLSPARYKIQCTVDEETHNCLRRLQSLMRHQIPNGDPAAIIKKAFAMLLADVERRKFGIVSRPRQPSAAASKDSRHIPMHVRREVSTRDEKRCTFVGISSCCSVCPRRPDNCGKHRAAVPHAQSARSRERLRRGIHGTETRHLTRSISSARP